MKNLPQGNLLYTSSVHPQENSLHKVSFSASLILWILFSLITFGMGLLYVGFGIVGFLITHAIFLSYVKGYGIKITREQFPNIYAHIENAAKKLQIDIPEAYIYNMDGIFNAFATHFLSRNFVIISASVLNACNGNDKKIEFIIAHEMVHLQRNHTRMQGFFLPSRIIPWLGNAYSKVCEYSCDGVAARFVMENKDEALLGVLLLPTADSKRAAEANIEAYLKQREESGKFWMTLVETNSTHPYSFNRIAFIKKIFGDSVIEVRKSLYGILLAPFFSLGFIIILYVFIIFGIVAFGENLEKNGVQEKNTSDSEEFYQKSMVSNSTKSGYQIIEDGDRKYFIEISKLYKEDIGGGSEVSYWNEKTKQYISIDSTPKIDIKAQSLKDFFGSIAPEPNDKRIVNLKLGEIPNPHNYQVLDYKILGSSQGTNFVRYIRTIDMGNYYVDIYTWTYPSTEEKNKKELFENIASFTWENSKK